MNQKFVLPLNVATIPDATLSFTSKGLIGLVCPIPKLPEALSSVIRLPAFHPASVAAAKYILAHAAY